MSEYVLNDNRDFEIINGKIYMMSRPNMNHVTIAGNIHEIFKRFLRGKTCKVYFEPDVFLDNENNFIPDIVVLCDRSKKKFKGIYGAPDLVIEILSPSTDMKDMGEKKDIYGKTGVKEYWIIDPQSKKITVYFLSCNSLKVNNIYYYRSSNEIQKMPDDDKKVIVSSFKVGLFNDMEICLSEVFEDLDEDIN
jgi:Uma2 family endonuclease